MGYDTADECTSSDPFCDCSECQRRREYYNGKDKDLSEEELDQMIDEPTDPDSFAGGLSLRELEQEGKQTIQELNEMTAQCRPGQTVVFINGHPAIVNVKK